MQNSDNITGTQPVEIEYPNDGIDIDRMIVPPAIQQRPVQQPINNAPVTRRPIRDEPYIAVHGSGSLPKAISSVIIRLFNTEFLKYIDFYQVKL
ncbi:unnamed protein product [Adineta steineri]|uniref:Uncharacterized protein n=1 Tax=Adineta steineri TaxID=433720 RepID=A0A814NVN6_9BILA|nr:unnamed protein product [Adineta steineri]